MPLVWVAQRQWASARAHPLPRSIPHSLAPCVRRYQPLQTRSILTSFFDRFKRNPAETGTGTESYSDDDQPLLALTMQDPYDRISMEPPRQFDMGPGLFSSGYYCTPTKLQYCLAGRELGGDPIPHLLPFWTIAFLFPSGLIKLSAINRSRTKVRLKVPIFVLTGLSVPAVPKSHWAYGACMSDLKRFMEVGGNDPRQRAQSRDEFNKRSIELYSDAALDYTPMKAAQYDPETMPFFAFGPPKLTRAEQETVARLHDPYSPDKDGPHVEHTLDGTMTMWAFPQYRMVYEVPLDDGSTAIVDPTWGAVTSARGSTGYVLGKPRGYKHTRHPIMDPSRQNERSEFHSTWKGSFYVNNTEKHVSSKAYHRTGNTEAKTRHFEDIVLQAMLRSPPTWNDPGILPIECDAADRPSFFDLRAGVQALVEGDIMTRAYLRWPVRKEEDARGPRAEPERESVSDTKLPPHLRDAGTTTKRKAAPNRDADSEPKLDPELLRKAHTFAKTRKDHAASRRKPSSKAAVALNTASKPIPQLDSVLEQKATEGRAVAMQKAMHDTKAHYATLGINVSPVNVLYSQEAVVNEVIRKQWHKLVFAHHPDVAEGDAGETNRRMAEINDAYAVIKTCELRVKYHNS